jgi:hypothetical protein
MAADEPHYSAASLITPRATVSAAIAADWPCAMESSMV